MDGSKASGLHNSTPTPSCRNHFMTTGLEINELLGSSRKNSMVMLSSVSSIILTLVYIAQIGSRSAVEYPMAVYRDIRSVPTCEIRTCALRYDTPRRTLLFIGSAYISN